MGWNIGGYILEQQIIDLYDKNLLTANILDSVMTPFCNTDCDTAGFKNKLSRDGKCVEEIICLTMCPEKYNEIKNNLTHKGVSRIFVCSVEGYALWKDIWENRWGIV